MNQSQNPVPRQKLWHFLAVIREAYLTSIHQPVSLILSIVIIAGMCLTVLLTSGKAAGAQQAILGSFDAAGGRVITIQSNQPDSLNTSAIDRITRLETVEWVGALGPATDMHNAAIDGGTSVPVRKIFTHDFQRLGLKQPMNKTAYASPKALQQLGMSDSKTGGVVGDFEMTATIGGEFTPPQFLSSLEPLVLQPSQNTDSAPVSVVLVIVKNISAVDITVKLIPALLGGGDLSAYQVSSSTDLQQLQSQISNQLGIFGNGLVIAAFALSSLLVSIIQFSIVMIYRKDFGRRRALGATKALVTGLVASQAAIAGIGGIFIGSTVAAIAILFSGDPLPDLSYFASLAILAVTCSLLGSLFPAMLAARRDPLTELRVP